MNDDLLHMRAALALARRGLGNAWPNPAVGCVLVKEGRVIGRGWTQPGGRPHAETEALRRAGDAARGATAYVTLEPCSHHGRTPPCCEALAEAGIARVVMAMRDPDPRVNGRGLAMLRGAGIAVEEGLLEAEARALNAGFFRRIQAGMPVVTLKLASTLDGRIATASGESRWITGAAARREVHALRARHDAILVGSGTVLADDPDLTCRIPGMERVPMLRVVAGLERADAGTVRWGGADVTTALPHRRGFGLLFQDHALFPHRRVGENVAFGLRMHGMDRVAQQARVVEVLALVGLAGFEWCPDRVHARNERSVGAEHVEHG